MPQPLSATDRRLIVAGTAALVVLHLVMSARVGAPTVVFDENGYLGNARWLAGNGRWQMPVSPSYAPAYPAVLAPMFAVIGSAGGQWLAVRVVNAVLLASVFPLLVAVLRRLFGTPARWALPAAAVGAVVPAVLASGVSAIAENLVLPLVPATLLAALAATETGRPLPQRLVVGPAVALLVGAHPRFTVVAAAGLVVLAWAGLRRQLDRTVALGNGALLVAGVIGFTLLTRVLRQARWVGVEQLEGGPSAWWRLVSTGSGLRELAASAIGQGWYLAAGSAGLALVGIALAARRAAGGDRPQPRPNVRAALAMLLVAAAIVFATSVVFFAQNQFRADHWVYGRHNDSFMPLWLAIAVAALLNSVTYPRLTRLMAVATAVTGALGLAIVSLREPTELGSVFSPFAVPALTRYIGDRPETMLGRATLIAVVAGALITVGTLAIRRNGAGHVATRIVRIITVVALAGGALYLGTGTVWATGDFADGNYDGWTAGAIVDRLGIDELCIDASALEARANLTYSWSLPDVTVTSYNAAEGQEPGCPAAVALLSDAERRAVGDRIAVLDNGGYYPFFGSEEGLAVWVRPGPEQQRLADGGALLPEGFPAALPPEARLAAISPIGRFPARQTVAPGGQILLNVQVTHQGTGAPWPDFESFTGEGRVRVVADIGPATPGGPSGARSGGELPSWMLPGDTAEADVEVLAVSSYLEPLPPGEYPVRLGIAQNDQSWFTPGGDDVSFTLVVEAPEGSG